MINNGANGFTPGAMASLALCMAWWRVQHGMCTRNDSRANIALFVVRRWRARHPGKSRDAAASAFLAALVSTGQWRRRRYCAL